MKLPKYINKEYLYWILSSPILLLMIIILLPSLLVALFNHGFTYLVKKIGEKRG